MWQVTGLAPAGGRFAAGAGVPLVGRRAELRSLRARFRRAVERRRCVLVTVAGPAGIGKSRLLREFLGGIEGDATVVVGRCLPYGEGITYWPLTEIVNELAGGAGSAGLVRLLQDDSQPELVASRVAAAAGWPGASAGEQDLQWGVRRLFEALARRRPLVAVFDDVHWAEPAMLDLIAQIASGAAAPILLVCSARGELLERRPDWESVGGPRSVLRLTALSGAESAQLLSGLAARRRARIPRSELLTAAEGNPLFLEHLVAMRADDPGGRTPPTIQALLAARIDGLPDAERQVVEAASIEGRAFHAGAVRALVAEPERVDAGLAGLVERELVRAGRPELAGEAGYRFTHILVRDAAYELLAKRRRADLHVGYAGWLLERDDHGPGAEEIVGYHLEQAHRYRTQLGRVEDEANMRLAAEAAGHLSAAGRRALAAGDRAGAANLLERAAALRAGDDPDRGALLLDLGGVRRELGRFRDAEASLAEARRIAKRRSDQSLDARAQVERLLTRLQIDPEGVARQTARSGPGLERTLTAAGDHAGLARLWHVRALLWWIRAQSAEAERAWRRAMDEALVAGDGRLVSDAVGWEAASMSLGPTPVREAIERCTEICRMLTDDPWAGALALQPLASLEAMRGEFDTAFRLLDESNAVLAGFSPSLDAAVSHAEVYVSVLAGDLDRAERHLRGGRRILERLGERAVLASTEGHLAEVLLLSGREREADRLARRCAAIATGDDAGAQAVWRRVRARVLAAHGGHGRAIGAGPAGCLHRPAFRPPEHAGRGPDRPGLRAGCQRARRGCGRRAGRRDRPLRDQGQCGRSPGSSGPAGSSCGRVTCETIASLFAQRRGRGTQDRQHHPVRPQRPPRRGQRPHQLGLRRDQRHLRRLHHPGEGQRRDLVLAGGQNDHAVHARPTRAGASRVTWSTPARLIPGPANGWATAAGARGHGGYAAYPWEVDNLTIEPPGSTPPPGDVVSATRGKR